MRNNETKIIFILDRSGSMCGLEQETIGGFNSLIEKQKGEDGKAFVTTVLFDTEMDIIHNHKCINDISRLTSKQYYPRGATALLDAVGSTILNEKRRIDKKESTPSRTLVIITTDGYENASKEFTYQDIKTLITKQKEIYDWEFLFLGANIDSEIEASKFGICKERTVNYHADRKGMKVHYDELAKTVSHYRTHNKIDDNWNMAIREDYKGR